MIQLKYIFQTFHKVLVGQGFLKLALMLHVSNFVKQIDLSFWKEMTSSFPSANQMLHLLAPAKSSGIQSKLHRTGHKWEILRSSFGLTLVSNLDGWNAALARHRDERTTERSVDQTFCSPIKEQLRLQIYRRAQFFFHSLLWNFSSPMYLERKASRFEQDFGVRIQYVTIQADFELETKASFPFHFKNV